MRSPFALMREEYLIIGGQRFCVCQWGDSSAPTIVLLHGFLSQGASWDRIAALLAEDGFFVIAPDLRGHGRSARVGRGSIHSTLDFLIDVDRTLASLSHDKVLMVGHSLGAIIGAITARTHSVRIAGLALIEPILPPMESELDIAEEVIVALRSYVDPPNHPVYSSVEVAARWLRETTPGISEEMSLRLAERSTEISGQGVRWSWDASLRNPRGVHFGGNRRKFLRLLQELEIPVTVIYGDRSSAHDETDRAVHRRALQNCREVMLPGGHNLYFDSPDEVYREIRSLAELSLRARSEAEAR